MRFHKVRNTAPGKGNFAVPECKTRNSLRHRRRTLVCGELVAPMVRHMRDAPQKTTIFLYHKRSLKGVTLRAPPWNFLMRILPSRGRLFGKKNRARLNPHFTENAQPPLGNFRGHCPAKISGKLFKKNGELHFETRFLKWGTSF